MASRRASFSRPPPKNMYRARKYMRIDYIYIYIYINHTLSPSQISQKLVHLGEDRGLVQMRVHRSSPPHSQLSTLSSFATLPTAATILPTRRWRQRPPAIGVHRPRTASLGYCEGDNQSSVFSPAGAAFVGLSRRLHCLPQQAPPQNGAANPRVENVRIALHSPVTEVRDGDVFCFFTCRSREFASNSFLSGSASPTSNTRLIVLLLRGTRDPFCTLLRISRNHLNASKSRNLGVGRV